MARKKGSLNKATVERLKAEGKWDEANNCPLEDEGENKRVKVKVKKFNLSDNRIEDKGIEDKGTEESEIEKNEIERIKINPSETNSLKTDILENEALEDESLTSPDDLIPTNEATKALESILNDSKGKSKTNPKNPRELTCERCGAIIDGSPYRIDTNAITARPDYHRETPRYINLCAKCSRELSEIVDKWLLSGECGKGLRKFPL